MHIEGFHLMVPCSASQMTEALQLQMEMQKQLHKQLEVNYNNTKKGTAKRSFKGYECFFICKYQ
jgi:hypothetical protein